MANTFKNFTNTSIGTSPVTVYTCPASTTAVVIGFNVSNTTGTSCNINLQAASAYLIKHAALPSGAGLSPLDGKIVLEAGDTIVVTSSIISSVDARVSVMEMT